MSFIDDLLEQTGLKYEDLTQAERETYKMWLKAVESHQITVSDIKTFVGTLRSAVANELAMSELSAKQDMFLKARLKNLILLEAMLDTPERARKALEAQIKGYK